MVVGATITLGASLPAAAEVLSPPQLPCRDDHPRYFVQMQPYYTGAPSQPACWSEYEPLDVKTKWAQAARIPSNEQLLAALVHAGPAYAPAPVQQAYAPVAVPSPPPLPPAPQPPVAAMPAPAPAAAVPPGPVPPTRPDANAPPGATGCGNEKIDDTTALAARRAFEAVGFQNVTDLRKGCDNVWHAHVKLNDRQKSYVMLNPQGDIYIEKNP